MLSQGALSVLEGGVQGSRDRRAFLTDGGAGGAVREGFLERDLKDEWEVWNMTEWRRLLKEIVHANP